VTLESGNVQRCSVLGTRFYAGTLSGAADLVIDRALTGDGGYATLTGVHGVTTAPRDAALRAAYDDAWMNFPDGFPVVWRQRRQGGRSDAERVGGPDLMPLVIDRGREAGLRHFLLGSTTTVLGRLETEIARRYPGAEVTGTLSPPFRPLTPDDEREIAGAVTAARPHILWVGLGAPKQDLWCHLYAASMAPALCVAVGAAFDFLSGNAPRAPLWMQRSGLEWVHRMGHAPRKLGPRYLGSGTRFVALSVSERLRGPKERHG
jgi:N-acetylglucosaminyldiphosphoundecaprenol N-acetyl-beta-D-mannosaminyltransferase